MIYLIDSRFTKDGALDIFVNQDKCPDVYKECHCLGCKAKGKDEVNQGTCFTDDNVGSNLGTCFADDNDNDNQGTCFADDNDKDNVNDGTSWSDTHNANDNGKDNGNDSGNDNVNDNVNDGTACSKTHNVNDDGNGNQGTCFADVNDNDGDDKHISIFRERTPSVARQRDEVLGASTKQRDKPCSQCCCVGALKASRLGAPVNSKGNLMIDVNGSL